MTHKHHIIPKHMGGTDDPSNLVMLTVEEHAEAHKKLFEDYGRWEDEIAWKGLAGIIGKEEIIQKIYEENGKKCGIKNKGKIPWNKGKTGVYSEETLRKMGECNIGNLYSLGIKRSEETLKKMRKPKSPEHKLKIKEKAIEQWSSLKNRKEQSERCKNNRDICPFCLMESNKSNITRHKKICKNNPDLPENN